ncbi:NADPH oxidase regulator NoxR [Blastomyces dermatitidis ER-3]|uniref:NADPH oxidase regulator NoxR n=1 Tax=Ajellomyces dermatitidis (strain ER-3 / ATCC MYA-2586) TaxID=559297 RepID=A0ABP2F4U9_AJEDR|nr:NADPH oxidase regulator NoxR [Blastomyces dermatitidis ER-3]EEQ92025.1 NADPH oxidase regulator NoxR [Blastomyces dermatitidis ER-3]EQL28131.1 hypothetical protein BDFG_09096 [Blastomyces dermatitidis ATCC 26199]
MSLKQEIETWVQALANYDNNEFEEALKVFNNIADTSKILFNCGVIYATLGEHFRAVECYQRAVALDQYFAVAYFQQGVSNFLVGDFEEALANFNDTLLYLRGNTSIDYEQLGLKFQLYSCEVLFNRGLCYIYLQQTEPGMQDLQYASKEKVKPDHEVIDEAIKENADGYTVFSIPVGIVYRPSEAKVKNLKTKEYLGKARLVAASDRANAFTGFQGSEIKRNAVDTAKDDRPPESISFAASNLVQKGLTSRGGRQQSEPPISRNLFPPTPPPESEKPPSVAGSGSPSNSSGLSGRGPRPPMLDLGRSAIPTNDSGAMGTQKPMERPRIGTVRTASEPRGPPSRQHSNARSRDQNGRPLYRETTRRMQRDSNFSPVDEDVYADEVYDMYAQPHNGRLGGNTRGASVRRQRQPAQHQPRYLEDGDYVSDTYEDDSADDGEFEMMGAPPPRTHRRQPSRRTDVRKIRAKVHASSDVRFIMIGSSVGYNEFEAKIRDKFGFKKRVRLQMQDDGDMVTMGDQDDLDMLLSTSRQEARREGLDMGKIEIWAQEV